MAVETAAANEAALNFLHLRDADRVLEIGFGHGQTIERAAERVPHGSVAGVDHSESMVQVARRRCAALIASGHVQLHCADSTRLPFANESFDGALAVHTLYFWQPAGAHLDEIRRVLVPGGRLVLAFRPAGTPGATNFPADVYTFRTPDEVRDLLVAADFSEIESVTHSPDLVLVAAHVPRLAVTPTPIGGK
jgi:ubiquinone/menaquinone biosynthesis C-methylase UbiE